MKTKRTSSNSRTLVRFTPSAYIAALLPALFLLATLQPTLAGSATWKSTPTSGNWNSAANWTPGTIPNGSSDTATFATSTVTSISLSAATEVNRAIFNSGASHFTISDSGLAFTFSGIGITN